MFVQTLATMKWLPMIALFADNAASTVVDKATLTSRTGLYLFATLPTLSHR